jgi:predicted hotdog family 3-hydroxylacyl-ACP dehydratase
MNFVEDILEYIPQRPPFVMIDKLLEIDVKKAVSSLTIKSDNLFCEDNEFYEGGIIENMAQTVAAGAGYRLKQENNSKPKIGVIGTVKNLSIRVRPKEGSVIMTKVEMISSFENALVVSCTVSENGITIAGCQMNIFIIENQIQ